MTDGPISANGNRPLRRSNRDRLVGGVASGLAEYLGVDVALVRITFAALVVLGGAGVPLYLAAWLFIPDEDSNESAATYLLRPRRTA